MKDLEVTIAAVQLDQEVSRKKGKYLPVSVLQSQGYKTDKIVKNCDKKWDEQLEEDTYMLRVEEEIEDKVRQDVVNMLQGEKAKGIRCKMWRGCSPSPAKLKQKNKGKNKGTKRPRDSSSSSSSSSSASSNNSKPPSTPKRPTNKDRDIARALKKEMIIKAKEEKIKQKQEQEAKALQEKAKVLKEKQLQLKLKKAEAEKDKKERRMACIYPLQSHAVTTAWLCFPVCPALYVRMIPAIIGEAEESRGNKNGCQRKASEGERGQTTVTAEGQATSNRTKGGGSSHSLDESAPRLPRSDARQSGGERVCPANECAPAGEVQGNDETGHELAHH